MITLDDMFSKEKLQSFVAIFTNLQQLSQENKLPTDVTEMLNTENIKNFLEIANHATPFLESHSGSGFAGILTHSIATIVLNDMKNGETNEYVKSAINHRFQKSFLANVSRATERAFRKVMLEEFKKMSDNDYTPSGGGTTPGHGDKKDFNQNSNHRSENSEKKSNDNQLDRTKNVSETTKNDDSEDNQNQLFRSKIESILKNDSELQLEDVKIRKKRPVVSINLSKFADIFDEKNTQFSISNCFNEKITYKDCLSDNLCSMKICNDNLQPVVICNATGLVNCAQLTKNLIKELSVSESFIKNLHVLKEKFDMNESLFVELFKYKQKTRNKIQSRIDNQIVIDNAIYKLAVDFDKTLNPKKMNITKARNIFHKMYGIKLNRNNNVVYDEKFNNLESYDCTFLKKINHIITSNLLRRNTCSIIVELEQLLIEKITTGYIYDFLKNIGTNCPALKLNKVIKKLSYKIPVDTQIKRTRDRTNKLHIIKVVP